MPALVLALAITALPAIGAWLERHLSSVFESPQFYPPRTPSVAGRIGLPPGHGRNESWGLDFNGVVPAILWIHDGWQRRGFIRPYTTPSMNPHRLTPGQIAAVLADCPDELCDLVLELRDLVCQVAPKVTEAIKFGALSYFKPDYPYGSIGGNVCMIGWREDYVHLSFIHGAALPDPQQLLKGHGKAKRFVEIRSSADIHRPAVTQLIRAALAYTPQSDPV